MTSVPRKRTRARGELPKKEKLEHGSILVVSPECISITVLGQPAPQGSKIVSQFGGMRESNVRTEGWRDAIARVCKQHLPADWEHLDGPLDVDFWFFFAPPARAQRSDLPTTRATYDWDKLSRAMCDGLQDGGVIKDDARIIDATVHKRYVWPEGGEPRAVALVSTHGSALPA